MELMDTEKRNYKRNMTPGRLLTLHFLTHHFLPLPPASHSRPSLPLASSPPVYCPFTSLAPAAGVGGAKYHKHDSAKTLCGLRGRGGAAKAAAHTLTLTALLLRRSARVYQ